MIGGGKFHVSASIGAAIYPDPRPRSPTFPACRRGDVSRQTDPAVACACSAAALVVFEKRKLLFAGLPGDRPRRTGAGIPAHHQLPHPQAGAPGNAGALESPEYGRLTARDFVHRAEMSDSIRVLTRWVIDNALAATHRLAGTSAGCRGRHQHLATRLLGDSIIVAHLQKSIRKYGLPARLVDLEITETSLIHNSDRAAQISPTVGRRGFSIIIDDYGVGFCSLAYLRRLPLKGLKMDNSFVSRVMQSAEDAIIVRSTIALAPTTWGSPSSPKAWRTPPRCNFSSCTAATLPRVTALPIRCRWPIRLRGCAPPRHRHRRQQRLRCGRWDKHSHCNHHAQSQFRVRTSGPSTMPPVAF